MYWSKKYILHANWGTLLWLLLPEVTLALTQMSNLKILKQLGEPWKTKNYQRIGYVYK